MRSKAIVIDRLRVRHGGLAGRHAGSHVGAGVASGEPGQGDQLRLRVRGTGAELRARGAGTARHFHSIRISQPRRGTERQPNLSPGVPQNEASALLTFYNDSVTEKVTTHGSLRIVIREGTTTI